MSKTPKDHDQKPPPIKMTTEKPTPNLQKNEMEHHKDDAERRPPKDRD